VRLRRLRVDRLPGIDRPFALDEVGPGVNVVVGPNASGKSSLLRALGYLLAGSRPGDPPTLSLEAVFDGRDRRWRVSRTGSSVAWRREGAPSDPPSLPDPRFLHCYALTAEDLLASDDGRDEAIVARIRQELTGGYDLEALLGRDGPFGVGPRHGRARSRALREAVRRREKILEEYRSLQRERERLPTLDAKIGEEGALRQRKDRVERARELLRARGRRIEKEAALEEFPHSVEAMEGLREDDGEALSELEGDRARYENAREEAQRKRERAEADLKEAGVEGELPTGEELARHRSTLGEARERLGAWQEAVDEEKKARARARQAAASLGVPPDREAVLPPDALSRAEEVATELREERLRMAEIQGRLEGAPEAPSPEEVEAHREAGSALRSWLSGGDGGPEQPSGPLWATVAAAIGGAGGALVAGGLGSSLPVLVVAVALGAGLGALAGTLLRGRGGEGKAARARFRRTGLEGPERWERSEVEARLGEIEGRLAELQEARVRAREAEKDRERLDRKKRRLEELEARKEELAREVGVDPELAGGALHHFVRLAEALESARASAQTAEARARRNEAEIRIRVESVRSFVAPWGTEPDEEGAGASEAVADPALALGATEKALEVLSERTEKARGARARLEGAKEAIEKAEVELEKVARRREELLRRAGLDPSAPDARTRLEERLADLDAFRRLRGEVRDARAAEAEHRAAVADDGELLERVEADDGEGLQGILEGLEERLAEIEKVKHERTTIETRVRDAGRDRKLEEATAAVEEARAALEEEWEEAVLAAAGSFLLERVKGEHRQAHEPDVLRRARERFARFTSHAWELEVLDGDGGLRARDRRQDELRGLGELSSGTRMQLLLAVRLAWAEHLEEGRESLPLFLDEALTTSDPERFARVAEALALLAREEGRQIFYLSARPADVLLWEEVLGEAPNVVDLGELREGQASVAGADALALPEREEVPAPEEEESPEAYGARLGVWPVDPWEEPGAIHVFHLLRDDLPRLHGLVAGWGLRTVGQLEGVLGTAAGEAVVPSPALRRRFAGRCRLARLWVEAWREGRGRPVDRGDLERSGAVSERFIDRVSERAEELGGDPRALLEALPDVPRFRSSKVEELEDWLAEHGFLPPGEPLGPEGRRVRVLREAAGVVEPGEVTEVVRWLEGGLRPVRKGEEA